MKKWLAILSSRVLCYDGRSFGHTSRAYDQIFITIRKFRVCWFGALSLTRGLLALASAVILGSQSLGTRDHILLSQIRDFPFRRLVRLAGHPHGSSDFVFNIVAYIPVAKRSLCKQRPVLVNGSVNTFPLLGSRFVIMQQLDYNNGDGCFYLALPRCYKQGSSVILESVLHGRLWREDLSAWSWKISTVRTRCQRAARESTAGWKRLSECSGHLWIVEISGGAVITCTYGSCV
jgi:hypothetical protein